MFVSPGFHSGVHMYHCSPGESWTAATSSLVCRKHLFFNYSCQIFAVCATYSRPVFPQDYRVWFQGAPWRKFLLNPRRLHLPIPPVDEGDLHTWWKCVSTQEYLLLNRRVVASFWYKGQTILHPPIPSAVVSSFARMPNGSTTLTWEDTQLQLVSQNTKLLRDFRRSKYTSRTSGF